MTKTEVPEAREYAQKIQPLLASAKRAFGSQPAGSKSRLASDEVNQLLLDYVDAGHPVPALADALEPDISLSGLRRRIRLAKARRSNPNPTPLGNVHSGPRKTVDMEQLENVIPTIEEAREKGNPEYGTAIAKAYAAGIPLQAIADKLGLSYYAVWAAMRTVSSS